MKERERESERNRYSRREIVQNEDLDNYFLDPKKIERRKKISSERDLICSLL
jgi:hypothetical protein